MEPPPQGRTSRSSSPTLHSCNSKVPSRVPSPPPPAHLPTRDPSPTMHELVKSPTHPAPHTTTNLLRTVTSKSTITARPTHFHLVFHPSFLTPQILAHAYPGHGTEASPYKVDFLPPSSTGDPLFAQRFSRTKKWSLTVLIAMATLAVAFASSAYSGGVAQILETFQKSEEVGILGISLFVLGFAIGPLVWAPMSELYGRQIIFALTYGLLTAFNAGAAGAPNMTGLLVLRFLAGATGSSVLTNAGGVVADLWSPRERGLAMAGFAVAPFMGPVLGPIAGGFLGESQGWRWVEGLMAIFTGVLWILVGVLLPETYAPALLRKRAKALSVATGNVYISKLDASGTGPPKASEAFQKALLRPWALLFLEPIVLLLSVYMAIVYGTLYMLFAAFPIVYQEGRGWSEGVGGLAFLGVAVGMLAAVAYTIPDNKRYDRILDAAEERGEFAAPPESRLPPCLLGSICLPVGLFWFAWTNSPSVPWIVSVMAGAPFGFGMVLVFLSVMNYLIDCYTIYAASVLAANSVLRSLFGAAFPLFTSYMYKSLGIHWASSIPAFLALMCVPFPFLFYKYGKEIRRWSKYSSEAEDKFRAMMEEIKTDDEGEEGAREKERERDEAVAEYGGVGDEEEREREAGNRREKDLERQQRAMGV